MSDLFKYFDFDMTPDTRPPKLGWATGWYGNFFGCSNCGKQYMGAKGSYHCSDCVYNYEDKIEYEKVWAWYMLTQTNK